MKQDADLLLVVDDLVDVLRVRGDLLQLRELQFPVAGHGEVGEPVFDESGQRSDRKIAWKCNYDELPSRRYPK